MPKFTTQTVYNQTCDRPNPVRYDLLFLSPHFDDVALSCGGRVAEETTAGRRVLPPCSQFT